MLDNIHRQLNSELLQGANTRRALFRKIEKLLGNRTVVSLFTSFRYPVQLDDGDADMLQSVLQHLDLKKGLALIVSSPGGDGMAAERIVNICRAYSGTQDFWAIVPAKAKSAGTLVCMGASKIMMAPSSELGPVDPQIALFEDGTVKYFSAYGMVTGYDKLFDAAVKCAGKIEPYIQQLGNYDDRLITRYRSFIDLSNDMAVKLLHSGMMSQKTEQEIKDAIQVFLKPEAGTYAHGRAIYAPEATACGLTVDNISVNTELWKSIYELYVRTDRYVSRVAAKAIESKGESFFVSAPSGDEE